MVNDTGREKAKKVSDTRAPPLFFTCPPPPGMGCKSQAVSALVNIPKK